MFRAYQTDPRSSPAAATAQMARDGTGRSTEGPSAFRIQNQSSPRPGAVKAQVAFTPTATPAAPRISAGWTRPTMNAAIVTTSDAAAASFVPNTDWTIIAGTVA